MNHQTSANYHRPQISPHLGTMPSVYLSTKKAARHLGLSHRTLEDWRLRGGGPQYRRFGGRVMYALRDLEAFADERVFLTTALRKPT